MKYSPSEREQALHPVMRRLEILLRQEDDAQAAMEWLEGLLREAGLVVEMRTDDPWSFVIDLQENLLLLDQDQYYLPQGMLSDYETTEDLIVSLMRSLCQ